MAALVAISLSPIAFFADLKIPDAVPSVESTGSIPARVQVAQVQVHNAAAIPSTKTYDRSLVDPTPALKPQRFGFAHDAPPAGAFTPLSVQREARVEPPVPSVQQEHAQPSAPSLAVMTAQAVQPVPLPAPRPPEFRTPRAPEARQMASAPAATPLKSAALPSAPASNQSFFEKFFGIKPASPPESALSYASLGNGNDSLAPSGRFGPAPALEARTAIYDITAKVVIMPNGERLEAHSGLGDKLDDPRYVHVRMRGATPPGTYTITEREALFHGVRALRLNPVGGSAAIHGRDGILAHTYMLGPNGDSNGCVSFRNYDRFLQAYLRGEVKRLVVVPGRGQDLLPRIVNNRMSQRA
ncbi:tlde1 domain-containing protein [Microvirga sp. 2TAF3]|uniref:DUF2778 domain-containing protein n=1 Tax=Microvirga sp. 2TAF3 TaxID=3233014 RepID=UPI003F9B839B